MTKPTLKHFPREILAWQWHAQNTWQDPMTKEQTSYLAGFNNKDNAVLYGLLNGWN